MYNKENNHAGMKGTLFLLQQMRQYKWYSIILPFVACVSQVSHSLILILLPKIVLDAVSGNKNSETLAMQTGAIGIALVIATLVNLVVHNEIEKCSQMFLYQRLTSMWQRKTIRLDYNVFISGQGKILLEKARQTISSPNWGIVELLGKLTVIMETTVGLVIYCILVGSLHPLILAFLGMFFLIELFTGIKIEDKKQSFRENKAKTDRRLNYIAYGTKGMKEAKDIRLFFIEAMLKKITREVISDKCKVETKIQKWQFMHTAVTAMMMFIRDGAAYAFLIYRYIAFDMSIGDFSLYFATITGIGMWLTKLSDAISGFREVVHYVMDFYTFITLAEDSVTDKVGLNIQVPVSFEFKNISFSYHEKAENEEKKIQVLKDINFKVSAGEKIAIVGVNGAGKSTLIKLLCGMLSPDEGEILVNEVNNRTYQTTAYYGLFSAVFQHSQILPVSIADNIMLNINRENSRDVMWECIRKAGLEEKIMSLPKRELTPLLKTITENAVQLSGGQEQKLLLARALYKDAPVLILDEPTAALDPVFENEIYKNYSDLTKGKTAFFVSHRLASTRFCDRIFYMEHGKIVETGTHRELMNLNGKYADMFKVQSKYYQDGVN